MTIVVRDARPNELPHIRRLTLEAYAQYESTMERRAWTGLRWAVRRALSAAVPGVERIVAVADGRLAGSVMLFPPNVDAYRGAAAPPPVPELRVLAVAPWARGTGVGEALVGECARRAARSGARELGLHTSRSLRPAIALYRRMGFERVPERDFRPEGAELVEAWRLALAPE